MLVTLLAESYELYDLMVRREPVGERVIDEPWVVIGVLTASL